MLDRTPSHRSGTSGLLIWIGVLLLMAGGVVAGPHLVSGMPLLGTSPPSPETPTPSPSPLPAAPTTAPAPTPTAVPSPTGTPTPLPPSPTPTPAIYPPTRVVIPSVGIDAPVIPTHWEMQEVDGAQHPVWVVPDAPRVGWHETSAPLGRPGNTVLNGHNWPENGPFRFLYKVQPGDPLIVYSGSMVFLYRMDEVLLLPEAGQPLEVRQANARYIQPTDDERVTLITCHPYGSTRFRLIVIARPAEIPERYRELETP
ncbi:MAG: sortase [Thermoflexales bacterium]|nr:sortase [Thermoflexales bacterium]